MKAATLFVCLLCAICVKAQLVENFSDGDFITNPAWSGQPSVFTVNGSNQLQLNNTAAGTSFLSTPLVLNQLDNVEWSVSVRQAFAPSSSNFGRVYLVSDQADVSGSLNGYYLQLGEANASDAVELFVQSGTTKASVCRGTNAYIVAPFNIDIKVSRSSAGLWSLYVKSVTDANFSSPQATGSNTLYNSSLYFGVYAQYTVSNDKNFYWDNITVTSPPDLAPPSVLSVTAVSNTVLQVIFSENLSVPSANVAANYQAETGIATLAIASGAIANLTFAGGFTANQTYNLSISGVADVVGNVMANPVVTPFAWQQAVTVPSAMYQYKDVVINELMADPSPVVGLPNVEYMELYNTTNSPINLQNFVLTDGSTNRTFTSPLTIAGGGYVLICSNAANKSLLEPFAQGATVYTLSGFGLTDGGEAETLKAPNGTVIDKVEYKSSWYKTSGKSSGGWSLELINPTLPCSGLFNWVASENENGGTPGVKNATFDSAYAAGTPTVVSVKVVSASLLKIAFSQSMDSLSLQNGNYSFSGASIAVASVQAIAPAFDSVALNLQTPLSGGVTYTLNIANVRDCAGNLLVPTVQNIGIGAVPQPYEVVINEIFADETPQVGLPEAEFVELYNTTGKLMGLTGFMFTDGSSVAKFPSGASIQPNGYIILCGSSHYADFSPYGTTYALSGFPSLTNSGKTVSLVGADGKTISRVKYSSNWYKDAVKADGGWSLEKVDPLNPCGTDNNWTASVDTRGGTPGKINSVYAQNPDAAAPKLTQAFATSPDTLELHFNEPIDSASFFSSYISISSNIGVSSRFAYEDYVKLLLVPTVAGKTLYTVSVTNLKDCVGNYIGNDNTAQFYLAEQGSASDIAINEILFDPFPNGTDFVEVFNRSDKYINLKDWKLANISSKTGEADNLSLISATNHLIQPKEYRVLTVSKAQVMNFYPKAVEANFLEMTKFPSFNDDEGSVLLFNNLSVAGERFDYKDDFHFKLVDDKEGVSLERIDTEQPVNNPANWTSAAANEGYATPGYKNSHSYTVSVDADKPVKIDPEVFTPDEDGFRDFTTISFNVNGTGKSGSIWIYDAEGRVVRSLVQNQLLANTVFYQWDGLDDNSHKVRTGYYMVYVEIFDLSGGTSAYKQGVVVGAKF